MGLNLSDALDLTWAGLAELARGMSELAKMQDEAPQRSNAEDAKLAAGMKAARELAEKLKASGVKTLKDF